MLIEFKSKSTAPQGFHKVDTFIGRFTKWTAKHAKNTRFFVFPLSDLCALYGENHQISLNESCLTGTFFQPNPSISQQKWKEHSDETYLFSVHVGYAWILVEKRSFQKAIFLSQWKSRRTTPLELNPKPVNHQDKNRAAQKAAHFFVNSTLSILKNR